MISPGAGEAGGHDGHHPPPPPPGAGRETRRRVAVVDLDGVVADVSHRLVHLEARPKDWEAFFAAAGSDSLLPEGRAVVEQLLAEHEVVYLSGRPERLRAVTLAWLARHGLPNGQLILRANNDRRPAPVMKVGVLRRLSSSSTVAVLIDDDPGVCEAVRRAGFAVLEADWAPVRTRPPAHNTAGNAARRTSGKAASSTAGTESPAPLPSAATLWQAQNEEGRT